MIAYLIAGAVAIAALGGLYWKVDNNGYQRGVSETKTQWDAAVQQGKEEAEAERVRQDALRATQDAEHARRLSDAQKRSQTLWTSLEAHIRTVGAAAKCSIPDSLRDDWNRANQGPEGERTGSVPAASGPATPSR